MSTTIPTSAQIQAIYGSIILANILTCWLFGGVLVLTYIYWQGKRHDSIWVRILVLTLVCISTTGAAACCSRTWKAIIHDFAHPLRYFQSNHAEDRIIPLTNNITAVATEAFMAFKAFSFARAMRSTYGLRIRILLYSIGGLLVLGWIANAGMALGVPLWAITHPSLEDMTMSDGMTWKPFVKFWYYAQIGCFVGVDGLLTICLASELLSARSGFGTSNAVIGSIVGLLMRKGLVILGCRIAQLLVVAKATGPWSNYLFSFVGQIYNITVLSLLLRPRATRRKADAKFDREAQGSSAAVPAMPTDPDMSMVKQMNGRTTSKLAISSLPSSGTYVLPMASVDEREEDSWPSDGRLSFRQALERDLESP